jgi:hypothetical protein
VVGVDFGAALGLNCGIYMYLYVAYSGTFWTDGELALACMLYLLS